MLCEAKSGVNIKWSMFVRLQLTGAAFVNLAASKCGPLVAALQNGSLSNTVASSWRPMANGFGAAWDISGVPAPPLDLRITPASGAPLSQLVARCSR